MKILPTLMFALALLAPTAVAKPPSDALKSKLEERYANYNPTGVFEGGKVKKGGTTTLTLTIDPTKDTTIAGECDGCFMFGLAASDETGKPIKSQYKDHPRPAITLYAGEVPSGKIKLEIDMTSGCEKPQCDFGVGLYHNGPRQ